MRLIISRLAEDLQDRNEVRLFDVSTCVLRLGCSFNLRSQCSPHSFEQEHTKSGLVVAAASLLEP